MHLDPAYLGHLMCCCSRSSLASTHEARHRKLKCGSKSPRHFPLTLIYRVNSNAAILLGRALRSRQAVYEGNYFVRKLHHSLRAHRKHLRTVVSLRLLCVSADLNSPTNFCVVSHHGKSACCPWCVRIRRGESRMPTMLKRVCVHCHTSTGPQQHQCSVYWQTVPSLPLNCSTARSAEGGLGAKCV